MKQEAQDKFVEECKKVHNGRYDYSITIYNGSKNDIEYICPKHGVIRQNAHSHKSGHGCRYCAIEENHNKSRYTLEDFIKKMRKVHGDKYDFSQAKYVDSQEEITLICHEKDALGNEHGAFSRKPYSLLQGHGCPRCQMPSLELILEKELQCAGINYEWQKKFDWLSGMSLDFYINDTHIAIECQGVQHFENKDFFDKRETLTERKERDTHKRILCKENGIELIYFLEGRFLKYANGENKYFIDIKDLLDYIVSKEDNFDE